jgi:hypothetical protein
MLFSAINYICAEAEYMQNIVVKFSKTLTCISHFTYVPYMKYMGKPKKYLCKKNLTIWYTVKKAVTFTVAVHLFWSQKYCMSFNGFFPGIG